MVRKSDFGMSYSLTHSLLYTTFLFYAPFCSFRKNYLITHNQQVNPIIEIIFYINANKIESVISYFDNCLWNMGIQKKLLKKEI